MKGNLSFQVGDETIWLTDFHNEGEYKEKRAEIQMKYSEHPYDLIITIESSMNENAGTKAPAFNSNQPN